MAKVFSFPNKVLSIEIPTGPYQVGDRITRIKGITSDGYIGLYSEPGSTGVYIKHNNFDKAGSYDVTARYVSGHNEREFKASATVTVTGETPVVEKVATPTVTVDSEYKVTLACTTSGAKIYYTTDGSTPTSSSTEYSSAFMPTSVSCTIKAIGMKAGFENSDIKVYNYNKPVDYLTFTGSSDITITPSSYWNATTKEYSLDSGSTWNTYTSGSVVGKTIKLRGLNGSMASNSAEGGQWDISSSSPVACSGNIETVLDYQKVANNQHPTMNAYCYGSMFLNCTCLTSAPTLPATTLVDKCYHSMFKGCTALTTAPTLPATTLKEDCYRRMFNGCSSLTTLPSLPATTLAVQCYRDMFRECTSITSIPNGYLSAATTLADACYRNMFAGCSNLDSVPSNLLPITALTESCYYGMFYDCSNLVVAPSLPATALATECYCDMFNGCSSLNVTDDLSGTIFFECPSTIPSDAVSGMFTSTGGSYTNDPVANGIYSYN